MGKSLGLHILRQIKDGNDTLTEWGKMLGNNLQSAIYHIITVQSMKK